MKTSVDNIFKKMQESEIHSKDRIQRNFDNLQENLYYSQRISNIGSWTHFLMERQSFFSDEIYSIFELADESLENRFGKFNTYVHPDDKSVVFDSIESLLKGEDYDIDYRIITGSGLEKIINEKAEIVHDKNNRPIKIVGVIKEISKIKRMNDGIDFKEEEDSENLDDLRGLKAKKVFLEELEELKEKLDPNYDKYGLIMIETEGIRHISFSLDEKIGDQLLVGIINRLETAFPNNDSICRYSDDHFALIIEGGKNDYHYKKIAKEIIEMFSKPFKIDRYELLVTVNVGICIFPKEVEDDLPLRESAKIALINSKKQGKNKYEIYCAKLNIEYYKELTLRSDLWKAIEKDQLELYYQPIVDLKTNEILSSEVLVRWNHPEWGLVPPNEFISIAEETGLIMDIGNWVLREVCKNYVKWVKDGLPHIKVGVNFSSVQLYEEDFVENIEETIREYNLDPKFLIIEIKENIFLENKDKVIEDIRRLREMGIQIALDDFGTGFSSLSYLNPTSINILKLDRSFIEKIPLDKNANTITRASIKLAKELQIKFVAKGLENLEQLSYLKSFKCVVGQGNLYSQAIPLKKFEKVLRKKECKPIFVDSSLSHGLKDRRKFFRIDFLRLLETNLTILEIDGNSVNVGNTKILVKNIGPGGLCFISNIRYPIEKKILLKFTTRLIGKEMVLYGSPVWADELNKKIYRYGVEFQIDRKDREILFKDLNLVQIKMRNNILFEDGNFIEDSYRSYFK